jgi:hypothetical protein
MSVSNLFGPIFVGPLLPNAWSSVRLAASYGTTPQGLAPGAVAGVDNPRGIWVPATSLVREIAPAALAANNIMASASPGAGAITLVSASGAGVTIVTVAGVNRLRLDTPRAVRYVSGGNDSGITFTMSGYDEFGVAMSETVTGANAGTATGKKAFLDIVSVTHTGSVAGTLTIGTTDVYGFPFRADLFAYTEIFWNDILLTKSTSTFVAADTTTATATTGDVRGTWTANSASDGTKRMQIVQMIPNLSPVTTTAQTASLGVTPA